MPHLAVVLSPDAGEAPAAALVPEVLALAARWPGRVSVVWHRPGAEELRDAALPGLADRGVDAVAGEALSAVERLGADAVRIPLDPRLTRLAHRLPTVVVADSTPVQRLRYSESSRSRALPGSVPRAAHQLWAARTVLAAADGLQCNGWGAWATYHEHAQLKHRVPPLLYFDSMLTAEEVTRATSRPRPGGPPEGRLRMVFAGRLHPADGPQHAVAASRTLDRWGVDHELVVHGAGPLEERLRAAAGPRVTFAGAVRPETGRMAPVAAGADLAVLPYLHTHPTGLEVELAGLGVPVVGFRSATLEGHRRFGGFTVTTLPRSTYALAVAVRRLAADPARREALAARGISFMSRHHAEGRRDAQVEHLLRATSPVRSHR